MKTLAILSLLLVVLGLVATTTATGTHPLDLPTLSSVRGTAPVRCNGNWSTSPCSEGLGFSTCQNQDTQAKCLTVAVCVGCSAAANHEKCSNAFKPWNAICDQTKNDTDKTGCGKFFTISTTTCDWNATTMQSQVVVLIVKNFPHPVLSVSFFV